VRNPFVLRELLGIAQENVTIDTEWSIQDLVDLGLQFKDFDPDRLVTYTPPSTPGFVGSAAILRLDTASAEPIFDVFRGIADIPDDPTTVTTAPPFGISTTTTTARGATSSTVPADPAESTTTTNPFLPQPPEGVSCG
jgi:hypothetical protein